MYLVLGKWKCATRKVMHYVRKWEVARAVWAEQAPRGILTLLWSKVNNLTLSTQLSVKLATVFFRVVCRTDNSIYKVCLEQE